MKHITSIVLSALLWCGSDVYAQPTKSTTGITFKASVWNMGNDSHFLTYRQRHGEDHIRTGGAGGWLAFTSRSSDYWTIEFAIGAFGKVNEISDVSNDDVTAVLPITLGFQRDLLGIDNSSALRPYLAGGAGPYWITRVRERNFVDEEVTSSLRPAAYLGGGLNFFFSPKFALNFDVRYHFVNLETNNEISGTELSFGFRFFWGEYKNKK